VAQFHGSCLPQAFGLAVLKPDAKLAASQRKLVAVGLCRSWTERGGAFKLHNILACLLSLDWRHRIDRSVGTVGVWELGHAENLRESACQSRNENENDSLINLSGG
jgi:hypothetical protein